MTDSNSGSSQEAGLGSSKESHNKRQLDASPIPDERNKRAKTCEDDDLMPPVPRSAYKIFADPIHGTIQFHPVCVAIIDTPQFQRLRDIKQLGLGYHVYPGAAHNRFEHSLGVSYLAGEFARILKENQPELGISNKDILCLEIAGLCHDLGHGPFSHAFDDKFVPQCEDISEKERNDWKHEKASVELFRCLHEENKKVRHIFQQHKLGPKDREFIKELILGPKATDKQEWDYEGRDESKSFLYEIVANKRTSIDVDKWDYIARDCHLLGIKNNFDHFRFMKFARVIEGTDSRKQICLRDKELVSLYNLFSTRYLLHKNAYQHKVICALDIMVSQALIKANEAILFKGRKISQIIEDKNWEAYSLLTDSILYKIRDTTGDSENLIEAQKIVQRIFNREFYTCEYQSKPGKWKGERSGEKKIDAEKRLKQEILKVFGNSGIVEKDLFVQMVKLDFGFKKENPIQKIGAYSKKEPNKVKNISEEEISKILKHYTFEEHILRIYVSSKANKDIVEKERNKLDEWTKQNFPNEDRFFSPAAPDPQPGGSGS